MSQKPRQTAKAKKIDKRDVKRENSLEEPVDEDTQPWTNLFRPTCAHPPKDNSFTLDDEAAQGTAEGFLSSFTISDPNEEGNPLSYVSPGFLSVTGYSENECIGKNCKFLQGGRVNPATHESLHSALSEQRISTVEVTNYRKDGRAFQNLLTLAPVLAGDGSSLLHYVGVQCDLDERRRRGEIVDEAFMARWQEQAKHCLSAFALVDVNGGGAGGSSGGSGLGLAGGAAGALTGGPSLVSGSRGSTSASAHSQPTAAVCAVSPGFTALTGYSQSDVVGWNLLCMCGPDSAERDMRKLITSQWAHTPTAVKLLCYKRDGTPFWALVLSYPLTRTTTTSTNSTASAAGAGAAAGQMQAPSGTGGRIVMSTSTSGRQAQGQGAAANRAGGLGLGLLGGGLLGGVATGGTGLGLLGGLSSTAVGLSHGGAVGGGMGSSASVQQSTVKHCLCCVVDITAQRLKKVVGGKYVLGKVIGAGAFGLVRIGKNTSTEELVAVKGVDATRFRNITELDQIQEEMSVLSSLKHPNIIRLYDVHFQNNTFFLVMEFAGNGSLVHFMRSQGDPVRHCLDEATAGRVFVQMVAALDYCHRRRVVHRDLKPENILMDEHNNLKIADFGLAAVAAPFSGGLTLQCGTPEFTAPEITVGREYDGSSVDIWSMGVILYEALSGNLPFKGPNQAVLFKAIQKGLYNPLPVHISPECKDLVRRMLIVDPSSRIKMEEILRHLWVVKANAAFAGRVPATAGSPNKADSGVDGVVAAEPLARLRSSSNGDVAALSGPTPNASSASVGEASRPGSAAWRPGSIAGVGAVSRGAPPSRASDGSGPGAGLHPSASRPPSAGLSLGAAALLGGPQSQGPSSPAGPPPVGLPSPDDSPSGALHDSVKLVIPSQVDRDDPILAAILRSHAHVGNDTVPSPSRIGVADDGNDGDARAPSYPTTALSAGGRREPGAPGSTATSARVGASNRSIAGMATAGGLHGQGHANGKSRGGALLPTLGGGAGGNAGAVLDRRLQDPSRFRSPARGGQPAGPGAGVRGPGNNRTQQTSQAGAPASPHSGQSPHGAHAYMPADNVSRQLPPIQTSRALGKKSSWMPGS